MVELFKEVSVNCGKIRKRSLERRVRKGKVGEDTGEGAQAEMAQN